MTKVPDPPEDLVEAIREGRCVLFAGAGLSRGIVDAPEGEQEQYLPTWNGLLLTLVDRSTELGLTSKNEAAKLRRAAKEGKSLFVAEAVRKILGAKDFADTLTGIFRNRSLQPTKRQHLVTEIPFAAVITTNYDKLLEAAYARSGDFPRSYTFQDSGDVISAISARRFFILKAHGDIDRAESIVLTEKDYRDLYYREPGYRAALNAIFIKDTVLFLGTSLVDPDVALVLESVSEAFEGRGSRHYSLVPWAEGSSAEIAHWREYFGTHLLRYKATKGHPQVDEFLKKLKMAVEGG